MIAANSVKNAPFSNVGRGGAKSAVLERKATPQKNKEVWEGRGGGVI